MNYLTLDDIDYTNKRVVLRVDFNVPIKAGVVQDDTRLRASISTIQQLLQKNASVILLSHLGRPQPAYDPNYSLEPIVSPLAALLDKPVRFIADYIKEIDVSPGEVILCENIRFLPGEMENDSKLAKQLAALGDIFVMDAFATAHRAQASTVGIAEQAHTAVLGPLMVKEISALEQATAHPQQPVLAIVGGSKISGKLNLLENLVTKVDYLIVGGGIANTFLAAQGYSMGQSLYEPELMPLARKLLTKYREKFVLPVDVAVCKEISESAERIEKMTTDVTVDEYIVDVGPKTNVKYQQIAREAKTILWNGPVGIFELANFAAGTKSLALAVANSNAFSIAGGGDTVSAIHQFNVAENISYISTGGGAFLSYLQGEPLPALVSLQKNNTEKA